MVGTISSVWLIIAGALLLFLLLVVLRFTLTMVRQVKDLAATVRDASERLEDALAGLRAEGDLVSERMERLGELGTRRRTR